jgi:hypothetical protein
MHELTTKLNTALMLVVLVGVLALTPSAAQAQFGIGTFTTTTSSAQAGGHPDLAASFATSTEALGNPTGQIKNASVLLPPGVLGSTQGLERCPTKVMQAMNCPATSQIGSLYISYVSCRGISIPLTENVEPGATTITVQSTEHMCAGPQDTTVTIGTGATAETVPVAVILSSTTVELAAPVEHGHAAGEPVARSAETVSGPLPLYNLAPSPGHLATFGLSLFIVNVLVQVDLRPDGRLAVNMEDLTTFFPLSGAGLTLWGVPGEASHDALRCQVYEEECGYPGGPLQPLTTYPTSCEAAPLETDLTLDSYEGETASSSATDPAPTRCGLLQISPSLSVTPQTTQRDTPSGYTVAVDVPQAGAPQADEPYGLATPALRNLSVTFPAGASLSPGLANGLQACSDSQFDAHACPNAAKVGDAEITTPLLAEHLSGGVYLGEPTATERYPVLVNVSGEDVSLQLTGQLEPDEATGQVTAVFENAPQLPFSELKLSLFGGPSAALANPASCGPATTTSQMTSYAGQSASPSSTFVVDENGEGGACPQSEPFSPSFSAGTSQPVAGGFSPFTLTVSRADGEQSLSAFTAQLPAGLVGMLKSVTPCQEPQAAAGTCAQSSEVGTATIGAGAGSAPLYLSGPVYLTGPYDGAPFGLTVAINAVAGPFNLGNVVIRSRILVNPANLALTIASDPAPQILAGIPLRLRSIAVTLNRPEFILNPTSCAAQTVAGTVTSPQGASVAVSSPFRVAECNALHFAPSVSASTQAKASSQGEGASLDLNVASAGASVASMKAVSIILPSVLRPRLSTIQHACLPGAAPVQSACAAESIVGSAIVTTPVIPAPLSGSVYLVAHGGTSRPSLVMLLHGDGVDVELQGSLNISHSGSISASFETLPDVPLNTFNLELSRGRHSILGAVGNLCSKRLELPYDLTNQSGTSIRAGARLTVSGCPVHGKAATAKRHRAKRAARRHARTSRGSIKPARVKASAE